MRMYEVLDIPDCDTLLSEVNPNSYCALFSEEEAPNAEPFYVVLVHEKVVADKPLKGATNNDISPGQAYLIAQYLEKTEENF